MDNKDRHKKQAVRALMKMRGVKYTTALREYESMLEVTDERDLNAKIRQAAKDGIKFDVDLIPDRIKGRPGYRIEDSFDSTHLVHPEERVGLKEFGKNLSEQEVKN